MLIDLIQGCDGQIICRHGSRYFRLPSDKGITCLGRAFRCGHVCSVILCDRIDLAAAVRIKGDRVLVGSPLCFQSNGLNILCRQGELIAEGIHGIAVLPSEEGRAGLGGTGQDNDLVTLAVVRLYLIAAVSVINDGDVVWRPVGSQCQIGRYRCDKRIFILSVHPGIID